MPKDEFDFDDPMELKGVGVGTAEDTTDLMAECFIEEFLRLGYGPTQLLALFRNSNYTGLQMILRNRGEEYVRQSIREVFTRWGRRCEWAAEVKAARLTNDPEASPPVPAIVSPDGANARPAGAATEQQDPMGAPIPSIER